MSFGFQGFFLGFFTCILDHGRIYVRVYARVEHRLSPMDIPENKWTSFRKMYRFH
jgi:hypothetical protein